MTTGDRRGGDSHGDQRGGDSDNPGGKPLSPGSTRGPGLLGRLRAFEERVFRSAFATVARARWGAASPRGSGTHSPNRITIHHTAGNLTTSLARTISEVRGIQRYHTRGHGWSDVGYHFLVDGAGRVIEGRRPEVIGAHVLGGNTGNLGISLMGDFDRRRPTSPQLESVKRLSVFLALRYRIDPGGRGRLLGHRHYNSTSCPGRHVAARLPWLRKEVDRLVEALSKRPRQGFAPLAVTEG